MLSDSKEVPEMKQIIPNIAYPSIVILRKDKLENLEVLGENVFTFRSEASFVDSKLQPHFEKARTTY